LTINGIQYRIPTSSQQLGVKIDYAQQDVSYDERHGGPYDRGSADAYYGREYDPHYFVGDTYQSDKVTLGQMTAYEITAYTAGYRNTQVHKEWN
jgi:hypothetical protein